MIQCQYLKKDKCEKNKNIYLIYITRKIHTNMIFKNIDFMINKIEN